MSFVLEALKFYVNHVSMSNPTWTAEDAAELSYDDGLSLVNLAQMLQNRSRDMFH